MFKSFFIMMAFFVSSTFALTGEFVALSTEAKNCNKVELMGASATLYCGAASMTGTCKVQEGYVTITTVDKNDYEEVYTFQIAKNGKELIGKNKNAGIVYVKYSDEIATPDSKLAFGKIVPLKPVAVETYNAGNIIKVGITNGYIDLVKKCGGGTTADERIMSPSMGEATKMMREYRMQGIVFSAYILDSYDGGDSVGQVFKMYVNDKIVYQQLKLAKTSEERWNIMAHYSKKYCTNIYNALGVEFLTNTFYLFYPIWSNKNDSYIHNKLNNQFPFIDSMSAEIQKTSWYLTNQKAFNACINVASIEFVVCDSDWNPVCWFDYVKSKLAGEALLSTKVENINKLFSETLQNVNKPDSVKTEK